MGFAGTELQWGCTRREGSWRICAWSIARHSASSWDWPVDIGGREATEHSKIWLSFLSLADLKCCHKDTLSRAAIMFRSVRDAEG